MGIFSRIKAAASFDMFFKQEFIPTIQAAKASGLIERFEQHEFTWQTILKNHNKETIAISGEHMFKYYSFITAGEGGMLLAAHIATYIIPSFKETAEFQKFIVTAENLYAAEAHDDGERFDAEFKKSNPKSAVRFQQKYGVSPFSPEIRRRAAALSNATNAEEIKACFPERFTDSRGET